MYKKILFVVFLIVFIGTNIMAQRDILDKEITYRAVNRDLSNVLVELSKKSGINIAFKILDIPEKNITFYAPRYTLKNILDYLLEDTGLKYEVINNQVVVFKPDDEDKDEYTINGYTTDSNTGEKLIFTNIYLSDFSRGTVSNEYGFYSIKIPKGKQELVFSYLGYENYKIDLDIQKDIDLNIVLKPKPARILHEVLITDSKLQNKRVIFFEPERISIDRIGKMVNFFGEEDIMRFTYTKPGVLTGSDGLGGMHVRGGNAGENLIMLDGVPVYNAQHAMGLFSVFNPSAIKDSKLIKSFFPARYSGGLSSVMDIRTRDGNKNRTTGEVQAGLLSFKVLLEGPLTKGKSSYLIGFRRTFFDIWHQSLSDFLSSDTKQRNFTYYFYDFNIKTDFKLNKNNNLTISLYTGSDNLTNKTNEYLSVRRDTISTINNNEWKWGNLLLSLQWNYKAGRKAIINNTVFYSKYNLKSYSYDVNLFNKIDLLFFYNGRIFDSKIQDLGYKIDIDYFAAKRHKLKFGLVAINHKLSPLVYINPLVLNKVPDNIPKSTQIRREIDSYNDKNIESRVYFEDKINFSKTTGINAGVNLVFYKTGIISQSKNYFFIEPRISFNQKLSKSSIFTISIAKLSQQIHTMTNNGLGLPNEIFLPSTFLLKPEEVWHFNTGLHFDVTSKSSFEMEAYYKTATNLVSHKEGSYFILSKDSDWQNYIPVGKGRMWGIESQWIMDSKWFKFWFNYTWSRSQRSFDDIITGKWFEYRFARLHNFNFTSVLRITNKINLFLTAIYGSGNPYTLPTQLTPDNRLLYEEKNNWHLPAYERLDIGMETRIATGKINQDLKFGIYNVLNRANPYYVTFSLKDKKLLNSNFKEVYLFPFLPSISYKIQF